MLTCHCTAERYSSYNDALTSTGQHKNKADFTHYPRYITHLHQHTWSIHNSYMSKCAYEISQIFSRVFEFALDEFSTKSAKINAPRILPCLQYQVEYSYKVNHTETDRIRSKPVLILGFRRKKLINLKQKYC